MKKVFIISMYLMAIFYKNNCVYGQVDNLKVENKKESNDSANYSLKPKYKYLNVYLKEEKNLIKIGFKPFTMLSRNYGTNDFLFNTSFLIEKKFLPEWTIITELEYLHAYARRIDKYYLSKTILNIGARHYYGMKKAIQQGNSGNNFNGNFLELSIKSIPPFNYRYNKRISEDGITYSSYQIATKVQFAWGIQRRLNNYTFFDTKVHFGCKVYPVSELDFTELWYVGLDFTIGFGYSIKRR